MWSFLRKREAVAPPVVPILPKEVLERGILEISGSGARMAMLYATMMGSKHETLSEANAMQEFIELIQKPPEFDQAGIALAVQRVVQEADVMCSGPIMTYVYGINDDENQHLKPLLEPYRVTVSQFGAKAVFSAAAFDIANFIQRTANIWRDADIAAISAKLEEKRPFLAPLLMRARAKGRNKYGDPDYTEFFKELTDFLRTYFNESNLRFFHSHLPLSLCLPLIDGWLVETHENLAIPVDGIDFEHWCAARIEEQGWKVRVSKAAGDQGIDIEAMKDELLIAIQCKRYAQPVGNKSVQEAYTGAKHYRADRAVVIGTGGYTKAAIELADNTGVLLLDAENIAAFTSFVMERGPA